MNQATRYAPDIQKALNGILLVCKPPRLMSTELINEIKDRIADSLNHYEPRPLSKRVLIVGSAGSEKRLVEKPNLADHPLVVGPRYLPWDTSISVVKPKLGFRSSGLEVLLLGKANKYYARRLALNKLIGIYHITGRFGYATDTFYHDGKVLNKSNYHHIKPWKIDNVLARIEATQHTRTFESSNVPMDSQEAYELAKAWPARPPKMAHWPVIYKIRCIHLQLPIFKLEVTVLNENDLLLAQLPHDIGQMLKSAAYTETIRRVKMGPFNVMDSLTDKEWDLQTILNNLKFYEQQAQKTLSIHVDNKTQMMAN